MAFPPPYGHRIGGYFAVHTVSVLMQRSHRRAGQIASLEDILQSITMSCLTLDIRTVHLGFCCCPYDMRAHTAFTSPYEHRIERIFRCLYDVNLVTPYCYTHSIPTFTSYRLLNAINEAYFESTTQPQIRKIIVCS